MSYANVLPSLSPGGTGIVSLHLYAWQPKGHGEYSVFVVAASEAAARTAIEAKIAELIAKTEAGNYEDGYVEPWRFDGWGTDYYALTVVEPGVVILNANE